MANWADAAFERAARKFARGAELAANSAKALALLSVTPWASSPFSSRITMALAGRAPMTARYVPSI